MSREVMKLALDMLNEIADDVYCDQKLEGVIAALRQALEREWVSLTDDEVAQAMYRADAIITGPMQFKFAKAIEQALKEKNHG